MRSPSSIFNFNRSNPLAGIILFALCVVVIEATLAWLPQNSLIRSFRANHLPPSPPDWQIMGDSVAAGGIRSDLLSAKLAPKTNTFNMALSGSGPEFSYFILQREIAAGVAPKAIVYAPSPIHSPHNGSLCWWALTPRGQKSPKSWRRALNLLKSSMVSLANCHTACVIASSWLR